MALLLTTEPSKARYHLHPVVVFSILDHYKRRSKDQHRVIGTLLGKREANGVVNIKNCFRVPHKEKEEQVAVDMEYHKNMLALQNRVNKDEVVVGWYSTGADVTYISSLMHEVYKNEVKGTQDELEPVHVTVDVNLTDFKMAVKAYYGETLSVNGKSVLSRFEPVPLELQAYEAEKIGVDALINGAPDDSKLDAPATILPDSENLEMSMNKLLDMLETVSNYANKVKSGEIKGDPDLGRAISHALSAIPHLSPQTFEEMFNQDIQDLLTIVYLSNLTRTQLALADKINGLLVN
jgi:translation initiation factor 3 subunit F